MEFDCLWSTEGMKPITHTQTGEGWRWKNACLAYERVEKGMSGTPLLQAFFWGEATPQHKHTPEGQPKVWSNHRLLNVLNIGGLIGSVEKYNLGIEYTHQHNQPPTLNKLFSNHREEEKAADNLDKLVVTVNQPFSRQPWVVCHENVNSGWCDTALFFPFLFFLVILQIKAWICLVWSLQWFHCGTQSWQILNTKSDSFFLCLS